MSTPAVPSNSSVFSTDNLRLATSLVAEGFNFEARPAAASSGGKANLCYFAFEASPELLAAAEQYYRGALRLDPSNYEESKQRVFAAVSIALGRTRPGGNK